MNPSPEPPTGVLPLDPSDPRYLGPFRLIGKLGSGGMGVVYAGLDARDHRVAVKCVHRVLASDTAFRARFAREVNLVRRVRAACVPAFRGADTKAEVPWLATEYVPGPTLDEHVRTLGPLAGDALTAFALGAAEALTAIHAAGVVHRDLKPGNVILGPDGPKVLDFGIARAVDGTALTRTGGLVGTPGWISPEQYRGAPATNASDVFSWAGLVGYAATGQGPFGSGPADVVVSRILAEPPALSEVPEHLHGVLEQALAKDPGRRPTAADLQRGMAEALNGAEHSGEHSDVTVVLNRTWAGVSTPAPDVGEWSRGAPPQRGWVRRNRLALGTASAVLALAVVAGLGLRALLGGEQAVTADPGAADAADAIGTTEAAAEGSAGGGAAEFPEDAPEDAPEEYRELYETGEIVVEPESDDEPVLIRRLEPASGEGSGLDQLRLTFGDISTGEFREFGLVVDLEYLPEHGSLRVHSDEFIGTQNIGPGQQSIDLLSIGNNGVLAELDPENPTARVRLVSQTVSLIYYMPVSIRERARNTIDYPGGFCVYPVYLDQSEEEPDPEVLFPDRDHVGPHDTTLTEDQPMDSCAYMGEEPNQ